MVQLKVVYKNKKLEKNCTEFKASNKEYGQEIATKVRQRIQQLEASADIETLLEFRVGGCHQLTGNMENMYAMKLNANFRLVFSLLNGDIHIAKIEEIVDYH